MTSDDFNAIDRFKEEVLEEYPRLTEKDRFKFLCHKDIECFNKCCKDVNIFLAPYDIIRMKNALGISSFEFLKRYTLSPFDKTQKIPVIVIKMEGEDKICPFVTSNGCNIYNNRPWACRIYPVGEASPGKSLSKFGKGLEKFYFLIKDEECLGFSEEKEWTVSEWLKDQDIEIYEEMSKYFKDVILHEQIVEGKPLSPQKMEMFYITFYDIDKFREFIFKSTFLKRFIVEDQVVEKIDKDDVELMKFGSKWLRFCLFGEKLFEINPEYKR